MTCVEYLDEIKLRLNAYKTSIDITDAEMVTNLNIARRMVQNYTYTITPERYGKISTYDLAYYSQSSDINVGGVVFQQKLDDDFIAAYAVFILNPTYGEETTYQKVTCRSSSEIETTKVRTHSWNMPTSVSPTYTMDTSSPERSYIKIAGIENMFEFFHGSVINFPVLEVWSVVAVKNLLLGSTTEDVFQPDFEELIIYETMILCLTADDFNSIGYSVNYDLNLSKSIVEQNYAGLVIDKNLDLPSKEK